MVSRRRLRDVECYLILTKYRFKGPKVNIDHMMMHREGNVIDGKDRDGSGSDSGSGGPKMVTTDPDALKQAGVAGDKIV
jgi:hypothetical protein